MKLKRWSDTDRPRRCQAYMKRKYLLLWDWLLLMLAGARTRAGAVTIFRSIQLSMRRARVKSSAVLTVGCGDSILEIEYTNGSVYQYFPISDEIYAELMTAESIGGYVNRKAQPF